ncbi:MupA/Atu3671 family FMN-dependent luciferase-like monooxygenase [Opitutus sp. GAS368]|uniref:MupA/Atu3671 family FMN-dependent luciferase-like monooxygenase n=1 Tax=Opitutus sp. GAS368 TaxID=1882749 RepID=UPI0015612CE1|nr:MupA/Atu3671 family FMN-dependent luciferase-like monooxygenase [Opitutus sp. GAS368]
MATLPTVPANGDVPTGAYFFPASSAQHRLWFLEQFQPGRALYNVPIAVRMTGPLDAVMLEHSLQELIARHEALRTSFVLQQDQPVQIVAPALPFRLPVTDLRLLPAEAREAQACAIAQAEARRPFDLRHPPLFSIQLLKLADHEHIFLLTVHHIIFDGWSLTVFFRELAALYTAQRTGRPPALPELTVQYGDFTVWQRERFKTLSSRLAWWKEKLAGSPAALELPADRPRPAVQGYHGHVETLALPAGLREPLEALSRREGATLFMTLLAAFQVLLHRHTGQTDLLIGTPVAGRNRKETEPVLGLFINTLVLRGDLAGNPTFRELLGRVRTTVLDALAHEEVPFEKIVEKLSPERSLSRAPLFQVMFVHERSPLEPVNWPGLRLAQLELDSGTSKFDLTLYLGESAHGLTARAEYDSDLFEPATIRRLLGHLAVLLQAAAAQPDQRIGGLPLLTDAERRQLLTEWNHTAADYPRDQTVHGLIAAQAGRTPDATAVTGDDLCLTYRELDERAARLAAHLRTLGIGPGALVGICLERSVMMLVGLLGILKAGAAYLPLDPKFPVARLAYIIGDAGAGVVLTQKKFLGLLPPEKTRPVCLDELELPAAAPAGQAGPDARPSDPAYVLYTSGSTGQPKGVVVAHQNVVNFFTGMNRALGPEADAAQPPGCWLAVTTISFDISVLELFWTLTRGFKVVIHAEGGVPPAPPAAPGAGKKFDFSLFYFASEADKPEDRDDKYRLLIEGAKFADRHGFSAVWTPERHFHSFGGLFPNPAVTGAAVAAVTTKVGVRGGSVVLPLHHPLRVAEEWAVVDNLSHGRVGIAFASGWHERDFALAPQQYARRREVLEENLAVVRKLWRGGSVRISDGRHGEADVAIHPRPLQPELPVWITASGHAETFRKAGELGANVITHLLGQSFAELEEKIRVYREARRTHGHAPETGLVTLMLHTFIGPDVARVRETVREPLCTYLKQSADLVRTLTDQLPATAGARVDPAELAAHIDAAFDRYFTGYGLFGTPESCVEKIARLQAIGIDELACLIDFGVATDTVLAGLEHLNRLKNLCAERARAAAPRRSLAEQIVHHGVTHLQCTPSLAKTLVAQPAALAALRRLRQLLVGGEPLPVSLAGQLHHELPGRVYNMYGPTETTVWSTVHRLEKIGATVPLGRPIANTRLYVLDRQLQPVPVGVPGELFIGGESVATGYLHRPELTAEKFLPDPFSHEHRARMYRTGDLVRFRANGDLEFLGRLDHQAKVRGHRVELGEIESVLQHFPGVREGVVVARADAAGDQQLVAYLTASAPPAIEELRRFLGGHLPDYMVPATYVVLDRLPLTPNGKIDRGALPAPDATRPALATTFAAPRPGVEQAIAEVWSKVLNVKNPGADDNFFDLGGHSLRVAQVQARLHEQLGLELPLLALFQYPTIRSLARCLEAAKPVGDGLHQQATQRAQKQRAAVRRKPLPAAAPQT